jgi:hypothetical protein
VFASIYFILLLVTSSSKSDNMYVCVWGTKEISFRLMVDPSSSTGFFFVTKVRQNVGDFTLSFQLSLRISCVTVELNLYSTGRALCMVSSGFWYIMPFPCAYHKFCQVLFFPIGQAKISIHIQNSQMLRRKCLKTAL